MRVQFVYGSMHKVGGIQTFLVRYAARLAAMGHEVAVLARPPTAHGTSQLVDEIRRVGEVHYLDVDWFRKPPSDVRPPAADVVVACDLEALLLACSLNHAGRLAVGVFHPREYCWDSTRWQRTRAQRLGTAIMRQIPATNILIATDAMARQVGECTGRDMGEAPVLPLGIDTGGLRLRPPGTANPRKIVSVTRIAPYYTHHFHLVRVIAEFRASGLDLEYHVYGDGTVRGELEAEAARQGVADRLVLHGTVPYDRFAEAVSDALLYVGSGTALAEAAACGVPALVAVDSHAAPRTYGFFHDIVGDDLGGYVPAQPEYAMTDQIRWLAAREPAEYRELELASRRRAEAFGLDLAAPRLEQILRDTAEFSFSVSHVDRALGSLDRVQAGLIRRLTGHDPRANRHIRRIAGPQTPDG